MSPPAHRPRQPAPDSTTACTSSCSQSISTSYRVVTIECVNELIAFGRFRVQKADTTVDASQDLIGVALCGMPDSSSTLIRRTLPCGRFDDAEIEGVQRVRRKGVWRLHGEWVWWP